MKRLVSAFLAGAMALLVVNTDDSADHADCDEVV